jgi:hypothetical protein
MAASVATLRGRPGETFQRCPFTVIIGHFRMATRIPCRTALRSQ